MEHRTIIKASSKQVRELADHFKAQVPNVRHALAYRRNSKLCKLIRAKALTMEGVKEIVVLDAEQYKELAGQDK